MVEEKRKTSRNRYTCKAMKQDGRARAAHAVSSVLLMTYWQIGKYIVEYEQDGREKAEYGSELLNRLSRDLTDRFGTGFSKSNVFTMRRLYMLYPKFQTLSGKLGWSHYVELLKLDDPLERSFYERECEQENYCSSASPKYSRQSRQQVPE